MHSCTYEGVVAHRRHRPVAHRFQYRLFMVLLDLEEASRLVGDGRLIANRKLASCSFLRGDHLFNHALPLDREVRQIVREQTGSTPAGPIRLLTQLRYCGFYFSPLNLFYVYDEQAAEVVCVVAEVANTPWKERHLYVLWDGNRSGESGALSFAHAKQLHVSPFMQMESEYRWRLSPPGENLSVEIASIQQSQELFAAELALKRRELSRMQLRRMMLRYPLMTGQISAAIYYQALRLWWKKCPFYAHPKNRANSPFHRSTQAKTPAAAPGATQPAGARSESDRCFAAPSAASFRKLKTVD